jgi:ubiquinone/menaquinone biosynthesis C-methylase UbiE
MLARILEPEVMDTAAEAADYDAMDHRQVNRQFVVDFLAQHPPLGEVLDVGTGTAQIPLELCRQRPGSQVLAIDLSQHMLDVAQRNIKRSGLERQIQLERVDGKQLPYAAGRFVAVISNSIIHHIPQPRFVLEELVRLVAPGGLIFVRDVLRPSDDETVQRLVNTYAADANPRQRQMFDDSLRAALSLEEIRDLVRSLEFSPATARATSDRHWTWAVRAPAA